MAFKDLFSRGTKSQSSGQTAKERMKFVLVHDRTDISMKTMEAMKNDIIEVISRYVNIDANDVVINIDHDGREQKLIADIPIRPRR